MEHCKCVCVHACVGACVCAFQSAEGTPLLTLLKDPYILISAGELIATVASPSGLPL